MGIRQIFLAFIFTLSPLFIFANGNYLATVNLNVRTGASTKNKIAFTLKKGNEVEVLEASGTWSKIKYLAQTGFVKTKYLEPVSTSNEKDDGSLFAGFTVLTLLALVAFVYLFPFLMILGSSKTTSGEKVAWLLAIIFLSWFAWIFYLLLAPLKRIE